MFGDDLDLSRPWASRPVSRGLEEDMVAEGTAPRRLGFGDGDNWLNTPPAEYRKGSSWSSYIDIGEPAVIAVAARGDGRDEDFLRRLGAVRLLEFSFLSLGLRPRVGLERSLRDLK